MAKYDKDTLKNSLSIEDVFNYTMELGGDPQMMDGFFISRTICHNPAGTGSHKLYYYDNTHLFYCYTDCGDHFDIYELTRKVNKIRGIEWTLPKAIRYVAAYFGYQAKEENFDDLYILSDWDYFKNKSEKENIQKIIELKIFDEKILNFLPQPIITPWEEEGIKRDVIKKRNIRYNPINQSIIIPHYNIDNKLVGIRERTLIKEEEKYGKYKPAILAGKMYNHPLSFNLYNLNNSKDNIKIFQTAVIFESEKSCLKYASFFGEENDISVAICGSNLISYQFELLLSCGAKTIIVALDRQYQEIGDEEYKRWRKKLEQISLKYRKYNTVYFLFDTGHLLNYKDAPIDLGKDVFMELYNNKLDALGKKEKEDK